MSEFYTDESGEMRPGYSDNRRLRRAMEKGCKSCIHRATGKCGNGRVAESAIRDVLENKKQEIRLGLIPKPQLKRVPLKEALEICKMRFWRWVKRGPEKEPRPGPSRPEKPKRLREPHKRAPRCALRPFQRKRDDRHGEENFE